MHEDDDDPTVQVPTFAPGVFFADRYRIDELLGAGAMGRVYAATELFGEERRVALKVLHLERLGEEEALGRFRREAEILASLGHPCIVEVRAFHRDADGIPYLAMELLEGVTLGRRLKSAGRFEDPRKFQEILDCIAAGLAAAHERGVVHRDLKPDNVFLPATGVPRAKIVDFGLSRMAKQDKKLTQRGMILGTLRYVAPEQIEDATAAGPAVDLYSLGVLLYESLSGQSPYPAEDYGHLLGCVLQSKIIPFERVRPDLPPALAQVVGRAMQVDPSRRFGSAGELADAYGAAIGSPSRWRAEARPKPAHRARRGTSGLASVESKETTLAFNARAIDLAAFRSTSGSLSSEGSEASSSTPAPRALAATAPEPSDPAPTKGDTVALAAVPHAGSSTPHAPPRTWAPSHARPSPPPQAPSKRRNPPGPKRFALVFLGALLLVVIVSAAVGFGLRVYHRGTLAIPALAQ